MSAQVNVVATLLNPLAAVTPTCLFISVAVQPGLNLTDIKDPQMGGPQQTHGEVLGSRNLSRPHTVRRGEVRGIRRCDCFSKPSKSG